MKNGTHCNDCLSIFRVTGGGALLTLAVVLAAQPAGAQTADASAAPPAPTETAEIVVTAQKRAQNLSDVPMSITALSGDTLAQHGVNDVQDLAKLTPGLSFVDSGASIPVYSLRGVGFFDTALAARPTVSVYVDEVPQPFSAMTVGSAFDLERVEILKGPQGTLFGQNATGGAINYIAAKPTRDFTAGVTASYARFNTVNLEGYASGPLSETLAVRLAGKLQRGDDWQYSDTRDDTLGRQNFIQGRIITEWTPTPGAKISLMLNGFRDKSDTQASQFLATLPASPALAPAYIPLLLSYTAPPHNDRVADWDDNTPLRRDNGYYQGALRGDFPLGNTTLTSITAYQHFKQDQSTDQDGTPYQNSYYVQSGDISSVSQELRLAGSVSRLNWVVGANFASDRAAENNVNFIGYNTTGNAFRPFGTVYSLRQIVRSNFKTYAAFANADYNLTDTIILHGGVRHTQADLNYNVCTGDYRGQDVVGFLGIYNVFRARRGLPALTGIAPDSCVSVDANITPAAAIGKFNQHNNAWRVGIDWKPANRTLIYANVSRGYKAGSSPNVNALSIDELRPVNQESVLAYEVGARAPLLSRRVDVSGAVFYYDYSNKQLLSRIITTPNLFGPLQALVNVPKSRVWGAELQITARPAAGVTLSLAGTHLNSKVQSDFRGYSILGTAENFSGEGFPYTPDYQMVGDGQYEWGIGHGMTALVGGNVSYRTSTVAGFGASPLLKIDGYALVDARVGVQSNDKRWSVTIFGQNLTDQYYWTNVAKVGDVARRIAGRPRMYGIRVSSKFF